MATHHHPERQSTGQIIIFPLHDFLSMIVFVDSSSWKRVMTAKLSAEILKIPLTQLASSPFNVRSVRPKARIEEIAHSLAEDGQKEPITVYPGEKDGEYRA
jgi:hypothetical protein